MGALLYDLSSPSISQFRLTPLTLPHHASTPRFHTTQGHPHATMAYLLVEAADVSGLQQRLQETIRDRGGPSGGDGGTSFQVAAVRSWEVAAQLLPGFRLGQSSGRAKEAAGKLLERQRENVVLVASLATLQALLGKTTVGVEEQYSGWGAAVRITHIITHYDNPAPFLSRPPDGCLTVP